MMEIIEKYSITLIQSIFGILIFQVVMMNMTIDIINYMRIKEGKEDLRGKKYKIGIICVFILLFGFGYLIVCSGASFWLLVFMDTVVVGIFTCIIGRINFIHIIMAMLMTCIIAALAVFFSDYTEKRSMYNSILNVGSICFAEFVIINFFVKSNIHRMTKYEVAVLSFSAIISLLIVFFMCDIDNDAYKYIGILCVILNCYMILKLVNKIKDAQQAEQNYLKTINDYELQKQYMNSVYTIDEHTRRLRHDIKNHFNTISILLEDEQDGQKKAREYVNQYIHQTPLMHEIVRTDNKVVNAVINSKLLFCQENGINTSVSVCKNIDKLSDVEICTIIGNLLDNAIEAQMNNSIDNRDIKININIQDDLLDIFIKNKISQSVISNNPDLKTTKQDKSNHGLGLSNVRNIVYKHGGYLDIYEDIDYICFDIRI